MKNTKFFLMTSVFFYSFYSYSMGSEVPSPTSIDQVSPVLHRKKMNEKIDKSQSLHSDDSNVVLYPLKSCLKKQSSFNGDNELSKKISVSTDSYDRFSGLVSCFFTFGIVVVGIRSFGEYIKNK